MTTIEKPMRPVRSYVLRQGRITSSQEEALKAWWPTYGLKLADFNAPIQGSHLFDRKAPLVMEIGFGMGDSLIALAQSHPEMDFIGVEVHQPGVGRCIAHAKALNLNNLKVFAEDALEVLQAFDDQSLSKVLLLFPDPWPKKRHHKRRIVQENFVSLVAKKLSLQGQFHLATDWQPYAEHMLMVLDAHPGFQNTFGQGYFAAQGYQRVETKFEKRGQRLGHQIWDLVYSRR